MKFTTDTAIPYKYGRKSKTLLLSGGYSVVVITQWLPVFTAAICVAALQALPKPVENRGSPLSRCKALVSASDCEPSPPDLKGV